MEYFDILNEDGRPSGRVKERTAVHRDGDWHRTAHVWIARHNEKSGMDILLQKRSRYKDSFPGCYDISSAGHIPAGSGYVESALRELREELGLEVREEELCDCGLRRIDWSGEFYGEPFIDRELSRIYLLWRDALETESLTLQKEEVEAVLWMDFGACVRAVESDTIPHCIYTEELEMIGRGALTTFNRLLFPGF